MKSETYPTETGWRNASNASLWTQKRCQSPTGAHGGLDLAAEGKTEGTVASAAAEEAPMMLMNLDTCDIINYIYIYIMDVNG